MSLAGFFKLFGIGPVQARAYILLWVIIALVVLFIFLKKLFGKKEAFFSLLLFVTFASFYGSGRTVVGEIPAFVFLILGFYSLFFKNSYFWTGFLWGLAVVTKPSVYLLLVPAIFLVLLLRKEQFFRRIIKLGLGMLPPAAGWIFLIIGNPFSKSAWLGILHFYANPFGSVSLTENILRNLSGISHSSTLIYFGILFLLVIFARCLSKEKNTNLFYNFIIIYNFLAFIYYLRSPNWLRYILIFELLILTILPKAVYSIAEHYKTRLTRIKNHFSLAAFALSLLVVIQFVHLFTGAQIFYSDSAPKIISALNNNFSDKSIGILNVPMVAAFLKTDKRFQIIKLNGIPAIGKNPLLNTHLPDIIVLKMAEKDLYDAVDTLGKKYELYKIIGKFGIYTIIK
ncbi:MAG: glycosyltransferase family 39 protein [bacterium]|nr:glycosyltransferase family 39 protein [bacterium]